MPTFSHDGKIELSRKEKNEIRSLFYKRVTDVDKRAKIVRLAQILTDEFDTGDFWAMVYHYSLQENWPSLERDFQNHGSVWDADTALNSEPPPNRTETSKKNTRRK